MTHLASNMSSLPPGGHVSFPEHHAPVFGQGRQHAVESSELAFDAFNLGHITEYYVGRGWHVSNACCRIRAIRAGRLCHVAARNICSGT